MSALSTGQAFFLTGRGKLANPDNVVQFFTNLGIPGPLSLDTLVAPWLRVGRPVSPAPGVVIAAAGPA